MHQQPLPFYADIITGNPDIRRNIAIYEKSFSSLKDLVERNDPEVLAELISSSLK